MFKIITAFILISFLCSCSTVEPWQKEILAEQDMSLTAQPLQLKTDDHIYFSKESSSGGRGFGGGGCGCN